MLTSPPHSSIIVQTEQNLAASQITTRYDMLLSRFKKSYSPDDRTITRALRIYGSVQQQSQKYLKSESPNIVSNNQAGVHQTQTPLRTIDLTIYSFAHPSSDNNIEISEASGKLENSRSQLTSNQDGQNNGKKEEFLFQKIISQQPKIDQIESEQECLSQQNEQQQQITTKQFTQYFKKDTGVLKLNPNANNVQAPFDIGSINQQYFNNENYLQQDNNQKGISLSKDTTPQSKPSLLSILNSKQNSSQHQLQEAVHLNVNQKNTKKKNLQQKQFEQSQNRLQQQLREAVKKIPQLKGEHMHTDGKENTAQIENKKSHKSEHQSTGSPIMKLEIIKQNKQVKVSQNYSVSPQYFSTNSQTLGITGGSDYCLTPNNKLSRSKTDIKSVSSHQSGQKSKTKSQHQPPNSLTTPFIQNGVISTSTNDNKQKSKNGEKQLFQSTQQKNKFNLKKNNNNNCNVVNNKKQ